MRALGIEISGSESSLVILDGTAKDCNVELLPSSKLRMPAAGEEVDKLIALKKQMYEVLKSSHVDCVGVIRADRDSSVMRAKVECMIQLAAKEASIACTLVPAQTVVAAQKRKVKTVAGDRIEEALHQISPAYLRKAVYCAWSILNARE